MKSDEDNIVLNDMCQNPVYNMILNGSITESEIIDAIKNGKAAGIDNFVNEYFHNLNWYQYIVNFLILFLILE